MKKAFFGLISGETTGSVSTFFGKLKDKDRKEYANLQYQGLTPSHWACLNNNAELLRLLRGNQANFQTPTKKALQFRAFDNIPIGTTPLHCACAVNSPECAELLLNWKVDVNALDALGRTAAFVAAWYNNAAVLKMIAENPNVKPDFELTSNGGVLEEEYNGCTPLMAAAQSSLDCVDILLEQYASPDATDERGWTAVHYACAKGKERCVERLAKGADVNKQGSAPLPGRQKLLGVTPLHLCCRYVQYPEVDYQQCVTVLIKHGADPNKRDSRGWTAAMIACLRGDEDLLAALDTAAKEAGTPVDYEAKSKVPVTEHVIVTDVDRQISISADNLEEQLKGQRETITHRSTTLSTKSNDNLGTGDKAGDKVVVVDQGKTAYDIARMRCAMGCVEIIVKAKLQSMPPGVGPRLLKESLDPVEAYVIKKVLAQAEVESENGAPQSKQKPKDRSASVVLDSTQRVKELEDELAYQDNRIKRFEVQIEHLNSQNKELEEEKKRAYQALSQAQIDAEHRLDDIMQENGTLKDQLKDELARTYYDASSGNTKHGGEQALSRSLPGHSTRPELGRIPQPTNLYRALDRAGEKQISGRPADTSTGVNEERGGGIYINPSWEPPTMLPRDEVNTKELKTREMENPLGSRQNSECDSLEYLSAPFLDKAGKQEEAKEGGCCCVIS